MKRNWFVIAIILLITVGMWAQVANSAKTETKAAGCACCQMGDKTAAQHDMKDMKGMSCCAGMKKDAKDGMSCCAGMKKDAKDGMACMRKDGKGCCAGMKKDAKATADAKGCCEKDCCKDGKCAMAKDGKKCCEHCAMAEGK